jgi:hypothetical protein
VVFSNTVGLVFGSLGDKVPQSFIDDRSRMRGSQFDVKAMTAALPRFRDQYRAHVAWIEDQLAGDGRERSWLLGSPSLADFTAYMNLWYVRSNLDTADGWLAEFPRVRDWESRIKAIGHGERSDISGEQALDIAGRATSVEVASGDPRDPAGRKVGDRVSVASDDFAGAGVEGEIVSLSPQHIAIRRHDPRVGEVVVHFPRAGYIVTVR